MILAGTLELTSKVRYGITSRGVPIFRFIPYDKRFSPMAVGCSQRNLFYNVHAIVEPSSSVNPGQLQRATMIQNLGRPTLDSELKVLLTTYAYDSRKEMKTAPKIVDEIFIFTKAREFLPGKTFHIDPPGCLDVDDSFTMQQTATNIWRIAINIADVCARVPENGDIDTFAKNRATSFYTPSGEAIVSMLPKEIEAQASLLPGEKKLTVSLIFNYNTAEKSISDIKWQLTETQTTTSYTYDQADAAFISCQELQVLNSLSKNLNKDDSNTVLSSHTWVESMMIFYNKQAGKLLASVGAGILRRHVKANTMPSIEGVPEFLSYESAEFCLPGEDTFHWGLDSEFYAYASSPIRRYADLLNQREIKRIVERQPIQKQTQDLVDSLNRRQKQAKAFSRDLFFATNLSNHACNSDVVGIVIQEEKTKVWVQPWNRVITVKNLEQKLAIGSKVLIQWYECREQPRWKDKIVFKLTQYMCV